VVFSPSPRRGAGAIKNSPPGRKTEVTIMSEEIIENQGQKPEQPQEPEQPAETKPAEPGDKGKMFTQADVDRIVHNRLMKERERFGTETPAQFKERETALKARESKVECREYLIESGYPSELLDIISTSDPKEFKNKADQAVSVCGNMQKHTAPPLKSTEPVGVYSSIHGAFANTKHQPRMLNSPDTVKMAAGQYVDNDD
jgi:hypothetical protein